MKRLTVNTKYENRYLLNEEISYDPKTGNQVWGALDSETDKRVLGRFQGNGKVEWFDDTRPKSKNMQQKKENNNDIFRIPSKQKETSNIEKEPPIIIPSLSPVSKPKEKPQPFIIPQNNKNNVPVNKKIEFNIPPTDNKVKSKSNAKLPFYIGLGILVICIILIGYNKRDVILSKINQTKTEEIPVDSTVKIVESPPIIQLNKPEEIIVEKEKLADVTTTIPQGTNEVILKLNNLNQIPENEQLSVFREAKELFSSLNKSSNVVLIDSLVKGYKGNGQQLLNGDSKSKQFALEWYKLAYALKPNDDLLLQINNLENSSEPKVVKKKKVIKKSPPKSGGFIKI